MKSPIHFQNQPAFELSDTLNRLVIAPEHGARILQWTREGRKIIHWPADANWERMTKVRGGNPILFPFIARHYVDGKNEFWRDASGTVRSMPQHGFAVDAKFSVIEGEPENSLRMRLIDSEATHALYPFTFQFDVVVRLLENSRVEVVLETTNTGDNPLPYYAGHHFYFAIPHQDRAKWTLDLPCASWGTRTADGAVIREKAGERLLHLDDPAPIDRFQIEPLSPEIMLFNTENQQRLVFELNHPGSLPWHTVTTWTGFPTSDFYCVEPWLGLPNAIHHGEGLRRLAPGQTEIAICVLDGSGW